MHIKQLTFTRFLAAVAIVIYHFGEGTIFFNIPYLNYLFYHAYIYVGYFFILSGFVMVISNKNLGSIDKRKYYLNRFSRIYPLYLLSFLIVLFFQLSESYKFSIIEIVVNIVAVQAWIPKYQLSLNYPSWSISVELFFYALFPLIYNKIYTKYSLKYVVINCILIWIFTQIVFHFLISNQFIEFLNHLSVTYIGRTSLNSAKSTYFFPLMHLNEFLLGNCAAMIFIKQRHRIRYQYWILAILIFMVLLYIMLQSNLSIDFHNGFFAVVFVPIILLLSSDKSFLSRCFKFKLLIFLGEISYGIYILQVPVYYIFRKLISFFNFEFNFYVYLVTLILFSSISFLLFEKPVSKFLRNTSNSYCRN